MKTLLVGFLAAALLLFTAHTFAAAMANAAGGSSTHAAPGKKPAHRGRHPKKSSGKPAANLQLAAFSRSVPDMQRYQRNRHSPIRYRVGFYRQPFGWFHHQWAYGERLPAPFITSQYWVANYGRFGLIEPPSGFVWVRAGGDAMLVEMDSGLILQAVYEVFY